MSMCLLLSSIQVTFKGGRKFFALQLSQNLLHCILLYSLCIVSNSSQITAELISFIWKWLCTALVQLPQWNEAVRIGFSFFHIQKNCCHIRKFVMKISQISGKKFMLWHVPGIQNWNRTETTHSSVSFWQNSQASGLILLMAFWLRWSCCSMSKP